MEEKTPMIENKWPASYTVRPSQIVSKQKLNNQPMGESVSQTDRQVYK